MELSVMYPLVVVVGDNENVKQRWEEKISSIQML